MIMERSIVAQIRLYYDVHVPIGYDRRRSYPLLIALHGYGGNKTSMMRLARRVNDRDWFIVSLQGPYPFMLSPDESAQGPKTGFGWAARYKHEDSVSLHHRALLDVIDDVVAEYSLDRARVFLMGFSQAVALNYRFVFTHTNLIRGAIGVCGGIPGDRDEKRYHPSETDVLHIATTEDEFYDLERVKTFIPWLERHARSVELRVYRGRHVFPRRSLGDINRWISERL